MSPIQMWLRATRGDLGFAQNAGLRSTELPPAVMQPILATLLNQEPPMLFSRSLPNSSPTNATPAFYRLNDVTRITALSRSTVYRRIAEGRFPQPVHLGGRASAWSSAALQAWIDDPQGYRRASPSP